MKETKKNMPENFSENFFDFFPEVRSIIPRLLVSIKVLLFKPIFNLKNDCFSFKSGTKGVRLRLPQKKNHSILPQFELRPNGKF